MRGTPFGRGATKGVSRSRQLLLLVVEDTNRQEQTDRHRASRNPIFFSLHKSEVGGPKINSFEASLEIDPPR